MFTGLSDIAMDGKGRLAMPARFRAPLLDEEGGRLTLTIDIEETCLLIYPASEWQVLAAKLAALPSLNPQARRIQRLVLGHAHEVEMDTNGRILLPAPLREFAGLDKHLVLVGQGRKFELWDQAHWRAQRDQWLEEERNGAHGEMIPELSSLSL